MISKEVISKTQKKLIKINMLVVFGFLILLCIFTYIYFGYTNDNNINKEMHGELNSVVNQLEKLDSRYGLLYGLDREGIKLQNPKDMVYIYMDDNLLNRNENPYFGEDEPNFKSDENGIYTYSTKEGYEIRACIYTYKNCKIKILREISSEISSRRQLLFTMIKAVIIFCVLTYFIAIYLTRNALKPIEITWNNQAKFIQDASHELRTPITIVSSKLEGLLKHPNNTINDEVESIADAMNETRRLKKMINDLLTLTKEDYVDVIQKEEVDLEFLVKDLCDEEDYIKVSLNEKGEKIIVKIEDNGLGIKKEEIPHLFDRFFRSENVRNKDIDGSGIGLSIAKVICDSLKYKLEVDSEYGKWTEFKISIPIDVD